MISFPFYFYRKLLMKEGSRLLPTYVLMQLVKFCLHFWFTQAENLIPINWWTWSQNMTLQSISEEPRKVTWRKLTLYISFFNYFLSFLTFFMVYFGNILPGYVSVFYRVCKYRKQIGPICSRAYQNWLNPWTYWPNLFSLLVEINYIRVWKIVVTTRLVDLF